MDIHELIKHSIVVYDGMVVCYPHTGRKDYTISVSDIVTHFEDCFATNNSTIAFVFEGKLYATPWTEKAYDILENAYYHKNYFYVPFSNGDYPKVEQQEWEQLLDEARTTRRSEYFTDCIAWCKQHEISIVPNLGHCFKIPVSGLEVYSPNGKQTTLRPFGSGILDSVMCSKLGKFSVNNNVVAFVSYFGGTYIAKGSGIIFALIAAGYTKGVFPVFLSDGAIPVDAQLKAEWEELPEY